MQVTSYIVPAVMLLLLVAWHVVVKPVLSASKRADAQPLAGTRTASGLLADPRVQDFFRFTHGEWSAGGPPDLPKYCRHWGKKPFADFARHLHPEPGTGVHALLTQCQLQEGEYLLAADMESGKGGFALTSRRFLARDGAEGAYKSIALEDIAAYTKGAGSVSRYGYTFTLKSGGVVTCGTSAFAPVPAFLDWAVAHFSCQSRDA